jgi:hypothetical protein
LFDGITEDAKNAFQFAVDIVNTKKTARNREKFEAIAETVQYGNEFESSKSLCKLLKVAGLGMENFGLIPNGMIKKSGT